jgi:hypothetical protein
LIKAASAFGVRTCHGQFWFAGRSIEIHDFRDLSSSRRRVASL